MPTTKKRAASGYIPTTKILLDSPSSGPTIGFERTAHALAQIIEGSSPRFAVGIFGGWGSGKTTLMHAIRRALPGDIVKVDFNAWRFEKEPLLLVPLLDTVRAELVEWSKARDPETRERVGRVVRRVGRVIRGLATGLSVEAGLPGAVKIRYDSGKAIDSLTASDDSDQPQSLYVAAFQELAQAFAEFSTAGATRVVVFIDDLDRCLPTNALDVLESMKLFFDLPGFIFVVGLDEAVVQRAVRARFFEGAEPAPSSTEPTGGAGSMSVLVGQLERDYVEKIFQVPYRLPPMLAEQLGTLLEAMYAEADLPRQQLDDFRKRLAPHLLYIGVRRRINPREVKRFLNTYTLQTLVRPELDRNAVLPLQTLLFRYDWRTLYDAILVDSLLFIDALKRYRDGEDLAFEDLAPELGVLPAELGEYLRSDSVKPLCEMPSLDPYLSSLESTLTTLPWISDAYSAIGRLRGEIRRVRGAAVPGEPEGHQLAGVAREVMSRLRSLTHLMTDSTAVSIEQLLRQIEDSALQLEVRSPEPTDPDSYRETLASVTNRLYDLANQVYRQLRATREALTASSQG